MKQEITSIQLKPQTKARLRKRAGPGITFDRIINDLLDGKQE